ncbi:Asp23/Gls24 family envelope stress response protein [Kineococcus sp. LSe6-4]|uniref:Asp23/Gls24 family envelope stress response protein n=1 Tax=Kineococcus halophytocola TaxID=3234027 RepID=A0ABV4GVE0_9ACTN
MAETGTLPPQDARPDAADRGRTDVADRVAERIATRAAVEVPGSVRTGAAPAPAPGSGPAEQARRAVGGAVDTVLGRALPSVDCTRAGDRVRVHVHVAGSWPTPAADLAAAVRDRVRTQLHHLGGYTVDACDVTVERYVLPQHDTGRRVE